MTADVPDEKLEAYDGSDCASLVAQIAKVNTHAIDASVERENDNIAHIELTYEPTQYLKGIENELNLIVKNEDVEDITITSIGARLLRDETTISAGVTVHIKVMK